jgi:DNA-binding NarL/FixJ family response regulator
MIRLLVADDHQVLKDGIKAMLKENDEIEIMGEAGNGLEVLEILDKHPADVVLLDINMPVLDGIETCRKIKDLHPTIKVLALTMYDEGNLIAKMVKNGAMGYILKNTGKDKLIEAIKTIHEGRTYFSARVKDALITSMVTEKNTNSSSFMPSLTRREKEIIELIVNEYTTHEIADKLFISEKTVETHRKNLLQKLNARNTAGMVRIAIEKGLVS